MPTVTVPNLTSLVYSASTVLVSTTFYNNNDRRQLLSQTATYQVCLTPIGHDPLNQGLAVTGASPGTGIMSPTSLLPFIKIEVPSANWPANMSYAAGCAIWLKKNAGNFYLHSILPVDTTLTVWSTVLLTDVQTDAISEPYSLLVDTAQTDTILVNRTNLTGTAFTLVGTIEEPGVSLEDTAEQIQYKPSTSTSYQLAVTRGLKVSFKILQNNPQNFVSGRAGEWVRYADSNGKFNEISLRSYQSAGAINTGNAPLKLVFPINQNKAQEVLYMYAAVRQNQSGGTSVWGKGEPPAIDYVYETINADTILQGVHAVSSTIREGS